MDQRMIIKLGQNDLMSLEQINDLLLYLLHITTLVNANGQLIGFGENDFHKGIEFKRPLHQPSRNQTDGYRHKFRYRLNCIQGWMQRQ